MQKPNMKLGEILLYAGKITQDQLDEAMKDQKKSQLKLGEIIVDKGWLKPEEIVEALEQQLGFPIVDLTKYEINPNVATLIPESIVRKYKLIAIDRKENRLIVAMVDPLNFFAIDDVKLYTKMDVTPCLATSMDLERVIEKYYTNVLTQKALDEFSEDSEAGLISMLKERKELVLSIERDIETEAKIEIFKQKVKKKDLALFCRQFYTMISAGLGIVPCLEILVAQTENKTFRNAIADTYEDVQKGMTLSQSMKENSDVFPTLLVSMVEAGEVSGNLDTIMLRMAEHFEKETKTENKVKAAMVYPAVLAVVAIAVVIFMLIFIMPTFVGMFEGTGTELPGLTKLLLNISNSLKNRWYIYIGAVIALVIGISSYKKTDGGRRLFDSLKLRLPVVKNTSTMLATSRFTRTLSTLLSSGIPLLQAMEVVARVVNNSVIEERMEAGIESIRKGVTLSRTVKDVGIFPPMVDSMIKIGEESGSLDEMLFKTADFYDEEVDTSIQKLTSMLEPIMLVVMGFVIGFLVIAMYLPMFDMMKTV